MQSSTRCTNSKKANGLVQTKNNESKMAGGSLAYRAIKRIFDTCFSLSVLVILLIPGLILAVAISIESVGGPIFRQERIGKNGRVIRIFKFRSMYADAHEHPEKYLSEAQMAQWEREQKVDDDPRITRIGRFIRKTSLDEVPQFVNVLIGDMSVVGPRPVTLAETYEYGKYRDEVLSVLPGITGWWQVKDRNDATWGNGRRQELELWYVRNAGILVDLQVIFATVGSMISGTGR